MKSARFSSITPAMYRALNKKRSKMSNVRTTVKGIRFPSKAEANRYLELHARQKAGDVRYLQNQVPFGIRVNDVGICIYRADFVYEEKLRGKWVRRVEDKKGHRTAVYIIKRKLMLAVHGIEIFET